MVRTWSTPPVDPPAPDLLSQVPIGPIDHDPIIGGSFVSRGERLRLLLEVLDDVDLGAYDQRLLEHYAHVWDTSTVLTIASWIRRAHTAGHDAGWNAAAAEVGG